MLFGCWYLLPAPVPTGDVRETLINSGILSSNCSTRGCEESGAIYFSMEDKYVPVKKAGGLNSNKPYWSSRPS